MKVNGKVWTFNRTKKHGQHVCYPSERHGAKACWARLEALKAQTASDLVALREKQKALLTVIKTRFEGRKLTHAQLKDATDLQESLEIIEHKIRRDEEYLPFVDQLLTSRLLSVYAFKCEGCGAWHCQI